MNCESIIKSGFLGCRDAVNGIAEYVYTVRCQQSIFGTELRRKEFRGMYSDSHDINAAPHLKFDLMYSISQLLPVLSVSP